MRDFVDDLKPGAAKYALQDALERRKPFGNFKATLDRFPRIREERYRFHDARFRVFAEEWVAENLK